MISTLIPVLYGEKWIGGAIESFLEQDVDSELIILDGSLNRFTKDMVEKYPSPKIRYFNKSKMSGIFEKVNFGLLKTRGDIFHTMACDHRIVSGTYKLIEREIGSHQWIFGNPIFLDEYDGEWAREIYPPYQLKNFEKDNIVNGCAIYTKTDFVRKNKLKFNEDLKITGDYEFYLKLARLTEPKQLEEFVIKIILRPDGLCDFGNNEELKRLEYKKIHEQSLL